MSGRRYRIERLAWTDQVLSEIALPKGVLKVTLGLGSGLTRRPGDPPGRMWAIGDRGPNLKIPLAVERYGLKDLAPLDDREGVKILPLAEGGPMLVELQVEADTVTLVRTLAITAGGRAISGCPPPGDNARMEPAYDLAGAAIPCDPDGADTEALVALADGTFWVGEEYGPSLIQLDGAGHILRRWTPRGVSWPGSSAPMMDVLPAAAAKRRLNRGFEAMTASPDGARLVITLQSAAEDEDRDDGVPFWTIDAGTGALLDEAFYPFDKPKSFERDRQRGKVRKKQLKVSDLAWLDGERLLVLERISHSTKIYAVELGPKTLNKDLVFDSDQAPEIVADLEGLTLVSDREMILVNDNDFGIEGVETAFFRIVFEEAI